MNLISSFSFRKTIAIGFAAAALWLQPSAAADRTIKIGGMGAKSGILSPFGDNSEAAMRAASSLINRAGGVRLGDGTRARIEIEYRDDRCDAETGVETLGSYAEGDWLAVVGTTCSSVLKPVFESLQQRAGDANDKGHKIPIFADVAMRKGLAGLSDWAFRNIPDEIEMYDALWAWMKKQNGELKTIYGGVEENFVHSNQTWYNIIKERAAANGFEVKGEAQWLVDDVDFVDRVRELASVNADIVVISAHPFTACGVLKEMERQNYNPPAIIGLTSLTTPQLLETCGKQASGMIVPTSFAPINDIARAAAAATAQFAGYADLHSMAAWENIYAIKQVIESEAVMARADTVQEDREKIRRGLQKLTTMDGLLGPIARTQTGESTKDFVFVEANTTGWKVLDDDGVIKK